jgi:hypothetical protein
MAAMDDKSPARPGEEPIKVIGRRRAPRPGLVHAAPFLELVIALREGRPFIPRGVYRFSSFEESQDWSLKMMARSSRDPRP